MPKYKTVKTVTTIKTDIEELPKVSPFNIGDCVKVMYGPSGGRRFYVHDLRWNHDKGLFEFLWDGGVIGGWFSEESLCLP